MQSLASRLGKFTACVTVLLASSVVLADISNVVLRVRASNLDGSAEFVARLDDPDNPDYYGYWNSDNSIYTWIMTQDIVLRSQSGVEIGRILATDGTTSTGMVIHNDPAINFGFAVQAGSSDTLFDLESALLSFPGIDESVAIGRASATYTVTNISPGGVTLTGGGPDGGAYLAQYNGFVPGGTDFAEQILSLSAPAGSAFATFNDPAPVGYRSVGAASDVVDMSVKARFTLTALDLASATSNYEIIPEPTTLLMVLPLGLLALRRR